MKSWSRFAPQKNRQLQNLNGRGIRFIAERLSAKNSPKERRMNGEWHWSLEIRFRKIRFILYGARFIRLLAAFRRRPSKYSCRNSRVSAALFSGILSVCSFPGQNCHETRMMTTVTNWAYVTDLFRQTMPAFKREICLSQSSSCLTEKSSHTDAKKVHDPYEYSFNDS